MRIKRFKNPSTALAAAAALGIAGLVGCGGDSKPSAAQPPQQQGQVPQVTAPMLVPVVNYNFFEPKDEKEYRAATDNSAGKALANRGYLIAKTHPDFKDGTWERHGLEVKSQFYAGGAKYHYLYRGGDDIVATMKDVRTIVGVMYIEPEIISYTNAEPWEGSGWDGDYDPGDPNVLQMRAPSVWSVRAPEAWMEFGFGETKPYVVDIDSGVYFGHQDLINIVSHAFSWYQANGTTLLAGVTTGTVPDPATGGPDPVDYLVTTRPANSTTDISSGHGTHTMGTMAAEGNNGLTHAGICWGVNAISYKGLTNAGSGGTWPIYGSLWHLAKMKHAWNYPYTIPVNMSLGSAMASQFAIDMVNFALSNDIMVVASAGNNGMAVTQFPGSYQGVMAVGATNDNDRKTAFSTYGRHLSVMAPGDWVLNCGGVPTTQAGAGTPSGGTYSGGTSMSAPHVTGLVGYMLTHNPNLKPDQIRTYIEQNADFVDGKTAFSDEYGYGRINVYRTIRAVVEDLDNGTTPPSNYVNSLVKIITPANGLTVHLYNCDPAGATLNYIGGTLSGVTYMGWDFAGPVTTEPRVAWFQMLRPGYYVAKAFFEGTDTLFTTPVFQVAPGQPVAPQTMEEDDGGDPGDPGAPGVPWGTLKIQTMPTMDCEGPAENASDTVITVYKDLDGARIAEWDDILYDTLELPLDVGTYWVKITDYDGNGYEGEYALYMTGGTLYDSGYNSPCPSWLAGYEWVWDAHICTALGTFASPAGPNAIQSAHAQSRAAAQAVNLESLIYGAFNYPYGTSGSTGHYYKVVLD